MDIETAVQMGILPNDTDEPIVDPSPLKTQIAGTHYKGLAIQPVVYCQRNGLGFCESSIIKYVSRHGDKNGKQDLLKARHFIDLLIELEYPDG
jgi:hypothetical protein